MVRAVVMPFVHQSDIPEPLVVSSSTDISGSVSTDTIVKKNRSLHVRGNLTGGLTIEPGADGLIINRGGRFVISHKNSPRVLLWTDRRKAKLAPS